MLQLWGNETLKMNYQYEVYNELTSSTLTRITEFSVTILIGKTESQRAIDIRLSMFKKGAPRGKFSRHSLVNKMVFKKLHFLFPACSSTRHFQICLLWTEVSERSAGFLRKNRRRAARVIYGNGNRRSQTKNI